MKYTVVRERKGSALTQTLYAGLLRWRAVETFARAVPEPDTVIILSRGREILRRSDEVVTLRCSICSEPIDGDNAPAVDSHSGMPTCDLCCNAQRHARMTAGSR